jgi:stringent starvation protein B
MGSTRLSGRRFVWRANGLGGRSETVDPTSGVLPPKKDVMLALLQRTSVFIHLDPRHEGVRVPPWFKKQPQLVLQVGLNMAVQILDLEVQDDAVSCTLSFSRSPFFCYVPWAAVFALVGEDGKGMLWPDDVPKEVAAQQGERTAKEQARAKAKERLAPVRSEPPPADKTKPDRAAAKKSSPKPVAAASPTPEKTPEPESTEAEPSPKAPREPKRQFPSYLRVVK